MLYIAIYFLFQKKKKHTLLILLSEGRESFTSEKRLNIYRGVKKDDRVIRVCIIYEDLGFQILKYRSLPL